MIVAATGHRPDKCGGYGLTADNARFNVALDALQVLKPSKVFTGMALGWDLAVADAALCLKIPIVACVPFKGQESQWPAPSRVYYKSILKKASEVVIVSEGGYTSHAMNKRNRYMVDRCHTLLALWNGEEKGGTYNCVNYASAKPHVTIHNVWDTWETEYGQSFS
jgi:uncharacterized phage-like protein YoqJ